MHADLPILQTMLSLGGAPPNGDIPVQLSNDTSKDGEHISYSMREILTKVSLLRGDLLFKDVLSVGMVRGATRIGDMILKGNHSRKDVPLLQFARHFRNACGHGDEWTFHPGQPDTPAACRGLTLSADLNGQRATWTTVSPRLARIPRPIHHQPRVLLAAQLILRDPLPTRLDLRGTPLPREPPPLCLATRPLPASSQAPKYAASNLGLAPSHITTGARQPRRDQLSTGSRFGPTDPQSVATVCC